jgi:membrane protease YdiL (CAAX protease family)
VGGISNTYLEGVFGELEVQEPVKMFQESKSIVHLSLSIIMACIAAPVVEEFLFRGYMYGTVKRLTNPVFAAVIIGGLFAVVHGNLPALLPLWVFSILLCLAYELTRCLWVPVGMHVFFNAANIVLMLMPESAE